MTAPVSAPVYTVPFLLFPAAAAPAEKALRKLNAEQAYPIMYSPQPAAFITADAMTSRMIALAVHAAAALAPAACRQRHCCSQITKKHLPVNKINQSY